MGVGILSVACSLVVLWMFIVVFSCAVLYSRLVLDRSIARPGYPMLTWLGDVKDTFVCPDQKKIHASPPGQTHYLSLPRMRPLPGHGIRDW